MSDPDEDKLGHAEVDLDLEDQSVLDISKQMPTPEPDISSEFVDEVSRDQGDHCDLNFFSFDVF